MALFPKNPNERFYTGGKKHFVEVLKNSGSRETLIWRQPEEDFNNNSTLIVMPGESAIFVKNGKIEQVFDNGTYKLNSQNYPFLSRLRNSVSGGISAYNSVVYFVKTAHTREILWGTQTPIQARDKVWGVTTEVRARGSFKIHVENPALFLGKLLGNHVAFETEDGLNDYFANEFQSKIKSNISKGLNALTTELIGIDAMIDDLSVAIMPQIQQIVSDYGLQCDNFNIAAMDVNKALYNQLDAAQVQANRNRTLAMGDAAAMQALGANWDKLQAVNIMTQIASNPDTGAMGTLGAGLGMGAVAGGLFGNLAQQVFQPAASFSEQNQPDQGQDYAEDPVETLTKLKKMLDAGLIEQQEYDQKKAEILARM